ncbi:MAG: nucleotidyltransferase domain-containing protein [Prevotellaceae bacterium]|jgi:predicted nucleotidyltransferase|nr:nucleotidyltransferase domain-containing protein [Prevotellaceae bacterium]
MLIREKDRTTLLQIFSSVKLPFEVWAYGSRVDGSAHEGSDLDLALRTSDLKPLPRSTFAELTGKIQDSTIPILVELRDWALLPENFHRNIAQQHEILYSNL